MHYCYTQDNAKCHAHSSSSGMPPDQNTEEEKEKIIYTYRLPHATCNCSGYTGAHMVRGDTVLVVLTHILCNYVYSFMDDANKSSCSIECTRRLPLLHLQYTCTCTCRCIPDYAWTSMCGDHVKNSTPTSTDLYVLALCTPSR